jgi:UDP-GlcNAc:undecaprenyl-phosphate GlcNAc-1-phosphate transferase
MEYSLITAGVAFLSALAISLVGTKIMILIAPKVGWFEKVKKDRWHTRPTAKMGGIAIYLSLMAVTAIVFWPLADTKVVGLLIGTTMIFILGLVDDLKYVSPGLKIIVETLAAAVVVLFGVYSEYFNPLIGIPLTVFWIIAVTNAYNLIDNMDGLSSGIAAISSVSLFLLSAIMGWAETAFLSAVMCGAALGFLRYNFSPARIFMGDCGALVIGFYLSVVTLIGSMTYMSNLIITLAAPILVTAVPILDTTFVTVLRAVSGRPVYQGGKDHTSHRLVIMGLSERNSVLAIYLFSVVFGAFAVLLALPRTSFLLITVLLVVTLIFLFLLGLFLGGADVTDVGQPPKKNEIRARITALLVKKKYIVFEIMADALIVVAAYVLAYFLMGQGSIGEREGRLIARSLPVFVFFQMISFYFFGVYRGVWKYVSFGDMIRIVQASAVGTAASSLALFLVTFFEGYSASVIIVYFFILTFLVAARAASLRGFNEYFTHYRAKRAERRVLIFGAGDSGNAVLREILNNNKLDRSPLGFLDDDTVKVGRHIHGLEVLGTRHDLKRVIGEHEVDEVIVAVSRLPEDARSYIEDVCRETGVILIRVSGILDMDR